VTLKFSEGVGGGHVLLRSENDTRIAEGRLVGAVGEDVYDTTFELPDPSGEYRVVLKDADDYHNNEIRNPSAFSRRIQIESNPDEGPDSESESEAD